MGRVISYGEKTGYNDGDYLLLDNGDGGTKRIRADRVGPKVGEDIINRSVNTTNAIYGKRIESNTGSISDNVNFSYVEFSVIPDDIIDYQTQRAEDGLGIAFYDSTDAFVSGTQAVAGAQTLTVPTNAVKARACYRTAQVDGFHVRLCKNIEHVVSSVSNSVIQTARNIEKANDIGYPDSSKYNIIQRADINRQKRLTGYSTTTFLPTFSNYASAASEIAEHFGIPFVDPFDDPFFSSYVYHYTMVNGHPTQVTYTGLSYAVMRLTNDCIETNENYYRYAGLEPFS